MKKVTKYSRRIRLIFGQAALAAGVCILAVCPWSKGFSRAETGYYTVLLDGREIGTAADEEQVQLAYDRARIRVEEQKGNVYIDADLQVVKNPAVFGGYTEDAELEDGIYEGMLQDIVDAGENTYTLSVGDVSVVLSSLEEISEVVDNVKNLYEETQDYQVVIQENEDERFGTAQCELLQASIEPENKPMVMAAEDGQAEPQETANLETLEFANEIRISENYRKQETVSVEDAVALIKDALQVVAVEEEVYTEEVPYETIYVQDENSYTDEQVVTQKGQNGSNRITAKVTKQNGQEVSRTVTSKEVLAEPVAQVIAVGTKVRPVYALPLANAVISDVYGPRWGTVHYGMDFSCGIGTQVLASADGTVTEAYYHRDFGNTVLITHANGTQTRYAHMSELLVQSGDSVKQGQVIGLSGNTGDSTGPHLHFEIIVDGNRVDPQGYLYGEN